MKPGVHILHKTFRFCLLAVAASIAALAAALHAAADTPQRSESIVAFALHARDCPSERESAYRLCLPGQPVSRQATEKMSKVLGTTTDKATLCALDAVVIRSGIVCRVPVTPPPDPFNALPPPDTDELSNLDSDLLLSDLMVDLAKAWVRYGNYERAEELFSAADGLAAIHEGYIPLARSSVLKEWLDFEKTRGQPERTLDVAQMLTASCRRTLDVSPQWPKADLTNALKTEADLLDRLGRSDEAEERRAEADSLVVAP
jgi:tetratricopeptide (TPR) repeat protein